MREMIREGQASDNEIDIWLASLAFIPKPDVDMLKEVKVCCVNFFGGIFVIKQD